MHALRLRGQQLILIRLGRVRLGLLLLWMRLRRGESLRRLRRRERAERVGGDEVREGRGGMLLRVLLLLVLLLGRGRRSHIRKLLLQRHLRILVRQLRLGMSLRM